MNPVTTPTSTRRAASTPSATALHTLNQSPVNTALRATAPNATAGMRKRVPALSWRVRLTPRTELPHRRLSNRRRRRDKARPAPMPKREHWADGDCC